MQGRLGVHTGHSILLLTREEQKVQAGTAVGTPPPPPGVRKCLPACCFSPCAQPNIPEYGHVAQGGAPCPYSTLP